MKTINKNIGRSTAGKHEVAGQLEQIILTHKCPASSGTSISSILNSGGMGCIKNIARQLEQIILTHKCPASSGTSISSIFLALLFS